MQNKYYEMVITRKSETSVPIRYKIICDVYTESQNWHFFALSAGNLILFSILFFWQVSVLYGNLAVGYRIQKIKIIIK